MGAGIAYALDGIGVAVTLVEADDSAADRARANVAKLFDEAVKRGKASDVQAEGGKARIAVVTGYDALPPADIAIEAVFENREIKSAVTAKAEAVIPESAIFASNTSTLPITGLAEASKRPHSFIGLHFFSPVDKYSSAAGSIR